jgi:hypothetical protein
MGQIIRMPTESEVPQGAVRDFAQVMFYLYKKARRPSLREISLAIARNEKLAGTASPETIRRILRGTAVPQRWETVEAVTVTLCDLGNCDRDRSLRFGSERGTVWNVVESLWHRALDFPWAESVAPPEPPEPSTTSANSTTAGDPWASDGDGFPDEPPF